MSPEMALSHRFDELFRDGKFRHRIKAIVVDEAHCINEWGHDDFRPLYRQLDRLRSFTGQDVPFLACTATCTTETFDLIWDTLAFGNRPFWGIDVGCDRPNLFFSVREIENDNPALNILDILPETMDASTPPTDIPKCLFYMDSEAGTRAAARTLRQCVPENLRKYIYALSADLSDEGKKQIWDKFVAGDIRILFATDAAGMGCNDSCIQYVFILNCPKALCIVFQRWGRAGRDRVTLAVCVLLVPRWAFRPKTALALPAVTRVQGKQPGEETKAAALRRSKLDPVVERFINIGHNGANGQFFI